MNTYWQNQISGFDRGAGNIATAIARGPLYRRQMEDQARRQSALDANAQENMARARLLGTQADEITTQREMLNSLATEAQGALSTDEKGRFVFDPKKAPNLTAALMRTSKGGNDSSLALGNFMKSGNATIEADLDRQVELDKIKTKPAGLTAVNTNGITGALTPNGAFVQPNQGRLNDIDKIKVGNLVKQLAEIDAASEKLAETPNAAIARNLLNRRERLEKQLAEYDRRGQPAEQPAEAGEAGANAPAATPAAVDIPQSHIDFLISNPDAAADFDEKYGKGMAAKYLKQP